MKIFFLLDYIIVNVEVGEFILEVVECVGVIILIGCLIGFCYVCEVEFNDS